MDVNYRRGNGVKGRRGQSVSERWLDFYMREDLSFIGRGLDFGPSFPFPVQQARTLRHGTPSTRPSLY